jgi:hypothetical protein
MLLVHFIIVYKHPILLDYGLLPFKQTINWAFPKQEIIIFLHHIVKHCIKKVNV